MWLPAMLVCLSVCLLARLLKNTCMDLDEILRVDRRRDMDELINFWAQSGSQSGYRNRKIWKSMICRSWSNRHLTQSRLQVTGCTAERYCLLHVVVQGPGSFAGSVDFSVRCKPTVAELRGVKLAQFSDFGLFPHTKPHKRQNAKMRFSHN